MRLPRGGRGVRATMSTVSVGVVVAAALGATGAGASTTSSPTTTTGSATPQTAAQLQAAVDHQLATTSGGTQVGNNVVSYDNGNAQIVFPEPGSTVAPTYNPDIKRLRHRAKAHAADYQGCPAGTSVFWSCFYQDKDFLGIRAQFKDCGTLQSLNSYNFADRTSSWVNTKPVAFVDTQAFDHSALWHEKEAQNSDNGLYSYSRYVGDAQNDSAWYFKITVDGGGGSCNN